MKILTWSHKNKGNKNLADFLNAPFSINWFFYIEGQSFFLHGQDKDNDSFTWPVVKLYWDCAYRQGKPPSFSTYSCERLNFPALVKIRSYSVTFVHKRLQLLRWFFTWTTHLFSKKKMSIEPQVIFAIAAKEQFAGACAILVVCQ